TRSGSMSLFEAGTIFTVTGGDWSKVADVRSDPKVRDSPRASARAPAGSRRAPRGPRSSAYIGRTDALRRKRQSARVEAAFRRRSARGAQLSRNYPRDRGARTAQVARVALRCPILAGGLQRPQTEEPRGMRIATLNTWGLPEPFSRKPGARLDAIAG